MGCPEFLADDAASDFENHAASCPECAAVLAAFADLDNVLTARYANIAAPNLRLPHLQLEPLTRPSFLPATLDLLAWSGVTAAVALALWFGTVSSGFPALALLVVLFAVAIAAVVGPFRIAEN